jgi:aquaporin Z
VKKYAAELVGTFTLVLFGCGTAVVANESGLIGDAVGFLGIALAFGFALIAMAYGIGPISGCHINPAVSLGFFAAGRMKGKDLGGYVAGQVIGAVLAAAVLYLIASGRTGYDLASDGLGQNGYGEASPAGYSMASALVFELVATFLFLVAILGSTQEGAPAQVAGLSIGITLAVIHIFGIPVTGVSVNPARSLGPALIVGGTAIKQVWLFLVIPSLGGLIAGALFRVKALAK